jgi:cysteine desulfurase
VSHYLDWAASAIPEPSALTAFAESSASVFANPASPHEPGRLAGQALEDARQRCGAALGLTAQRLYFTSGGTESNQIPILSLLRRPVKGSIAISAVEHAAVREQARAMESLGFTVHSIPCGRDGIVKVPDVLSAVREDTLLVAVMAVNNETGAIQPVGEIASALASARIGKKRVHLHVDAVQAVGVLDGTLGHPDIDTMAFSGHKLGAPRGIGILYANRPFESFLRGGGQEGGMRSGTVNVPGAVALASALERVPAKKESLTRSCEILMRALAAIPGVTTLPAGRDPNDARFSPAIAQFTNDKLPGEVIVRALSERGIYVSTGSACASRKATRETLEAMNVPARVAQNAFRVSIGHSTNDEDIRALALALEHILQEA